MAIVYIGVALLALAFMIAVHELGHYTAAKILKFRVNEFAIGFGKPLFKHVNKKTGEVFSIRMIPLGGFCAFETDDPTDAPGAIKQERPEGVKYPTYQEMAPWKRLIVLFMGAFFNFVCGVIFSIVFLTVIGYHQQLEVTNLDTAPQNSALHAQVLDADGNIEKRGDIIIAVDGKKFTYFNNYSKVFANYDTGEKFTLTVIRDGETAPIDVEVYKAQVISNNGTESIGIGITGGLVSFVPMDFIPALGKSFVFAGEIAWLVLEVLFKMLTLQMSWSEMGGTLSTVAVMGEVVGASMMNLIILIPLISVNLAVFNLLPIPALDGARMVFTAIEWIRKKPINPDLEAKIHNIGIICLFAFIILLDFNYLIIQRLF